VIGGHGSWVVRMRGYARAQYSRLTGSRFARDAALLTGVTAIERFAALVQTVLIARALGIVEYGVYGLLFTSIGFVSSVIGLQMGLTATVLVARYRDQEKAKAAAVIGHVSRFALFVALAFCVLSIGFSPELSIWLLGSGDYVRAIGLGCVFIGASLFSGVQDGIAQGFEDFRSVALVRFAAVAVTLLSIYPAALLAGLDGVILAILGGVLLKTFVLHKIIGRHRRTHALPARGAGVGFVAMVLRFSLPSMLASLVLGGVTWWGSFVLSRQPLGFESVALVNTGLQWRAPVLLLAGSLGSVAVPVFSRLAGIEDAQGSQRFRQQMLRLNGAAALLMATVLVLLSQPLLGMYGDEFRDGGLIFAILVGTTVPLVLANVHMQVLVGSGLLWRQFGLHLPMVVVMGIGFAVLIPRHDGLGYAAAVAIASLVFLASAVLGRAPTRPPRLSSSPPA
jgi:O-antigen/teichoic acid export membrane protein